MPLLAMLRVDAVLLRGESSWLCSSSLLGCGACLAEVLVLVCVRVCVCVSVHEGGVRCVSSCVATCTNGEALIYCSGCRRHVY